MGIQERLLMNILDCGNWDLDFLENVMYNFEIVTGQTINDLFENIDNFDYHTILHATLEKIVMYVPRYITNNIKDIEPECNNISYISKKLYEILIDTEYNLNYIDSSLNTNNENINTLLDLITFEDNREKDRQAIELKINELARKVVKELTKEKRN